MITIETPNPFEVAQQYLAFNWVHIEFTSDCNKPFSKVYVLSSKEMEELKK